MPTLEALNQPPPLQGHYAFDADPALPEALEREGGFWALDRARELGSLVASEERVEALALALEAGLLVRHAPEAVQDAFCSSRLGDRGLAFGTLPHAEADTIIERTLEI